MQMTHIFQNELKHFLNKYWQQRNSIMIFKCLFKVYSRKFRFQFEL